ncbi:MAG: efflux RND transporter permease subunit [Firmicutes bacterium]|nr:efflux RND transporter permease subunit [Bacillota bacterium]
MGPGNLAVRRPVTMLMLMLVVILLGAISLNHLSLELLPRFEPPVLAVYTNWGQASPQETATMITEPLEQVVATIGGLKEVSSISAEGSSVIICELAWGANLDAARDEIKERIGLIPLPDDAGQPMVLRYDPTTMPGLRLSVWGDVDEDRLETVVRDVLLPGLESVPGVASVDISGLNEQQVQVTVSQPDLAELGMDLGTLANMIRAGNVLMPAGTVANDESEYSVRVVGEFDCLEELGRVVVGRNSDGFVLLDQVADIADGRAPGASIVRTNGQQSLGLAVRKEGDANLVRVNRDVMSRLEELSGQLDEVEVVVTMNQAEFIEEAIQGIGTNLLVGAGLAVLVLLTLMQSILSTLIIAVAIPFSVVATFVMMHFGGLTLNLMSMGGLALGVGMLVDNSIVVIENIYRHIQGGASTAEAAARGTNEVAGAITASTLTTLAVFLPVVFVGGVTGELFRELAWTVSFSLLASLLVAITVIPMLASRILPYGRWNQALRPRSSRSTYARMVRGALRRRGLVLLVALGLVAVSAIPFLYLGREFLPAIDEGSFNISVTLPPGASLSATDTVAADLEALLATHPDVDIYSTRVGPGGGVSMSEGGKNTASIDVRLLPPEQRASETDAVVAWVRGEAEKLLSPDVEFAVASQDQFSSMAGSDNLQLEVRGPSLEEVQRLSLEFLEDLQTVPELGEATSNLEQQLPEKKVVLDRQRVAALGLMPAQVATQVNAAMGGVFATRLNRDGNNLDVQVQYRPEDIDNPDKLRHLSISLPGGHNLPLIMLADIEDGQGPISIHRSRQQPAAQITAPILSGDLGSAIAEVEALIERVQLPGGYSASVTGSGQLMQEGFQSLYGALALAVVLVYALMAGLFESLLHPLVIIISLPLAAVGALWLLLVGGHALGITAMIGLIMLAGIVVNNAIVMVTAINQLRGEGMPVREAIATGAAMRLRPILMTAFTTVLAMLPLALGIGSGAELQAPLATAVIGGLLSSTVMILVVVPVTYSLFAGRRHV